MIKELLLPLQSFTLRWY